MAHVMIRILVPMDVMGWGRAGCYAGRGRNVSTRQLCERGDSLRGGWVADVMECWQYGCTGRNQFLWPV